jgi:membrane protein involved in D-alanine export
MLPRKFVFLDAFPLTANGKADRAQLAQSSVIPYADFTYFGLLLYAVVPTFILGLFGKAGWRWATLVTAAMLIVQYHGSLDIRPILQSAKSGSSSVSPSGNGQRCAYSQKAGARAGWPFYVAVAAGLLPLAASKLVPIVSPESEFGFLGISYVTFRALDVVFCLRDKVIALPGALDFSMFLFFFPTISAGPIDRFNASQATGEKREPALNFLSISTARCIAFFAGSFTSSFLPR